MIVLTVDQRGSRSDSDRVEAARALLTPLGWLRAPDRTAGDELQAVTDDAAVAVDAALALLADGHWSVGIGVGPVERPLPEQTRAGRGRAFESAREAVEAAKGTAVPVQVRGADGAAATRAEAILSVLGLIVSRRSREGQEVAALLNTGMTITAAAAELGVSRQAASQRAAAAGWSVEPAGRALAVELLTAADAAATAGADA
ncbi:hypothetical protein AXK57_11245 [Tsukamurella pulmonis]|uniref:SatD family (SatD) n=2 Tax=Tsukamurella pulmonis TaxID=47312 RepID=A0A1H1EU14_9ACTN|nr:hypothetical protein [Tsukamurella pulmonis]KXO91803.1 hypothetical protein AXK56_01375 [Tsukamurella pulmonis]KXP09457.1 hypothetical protein AXK57_11245 [Tsukamurella pulmonis]SDQ92265.1 hypothetical protein SAMN04489765_2362 [Tsukamurella pulmonis]SUP20484.1 Uncharacterised protein [Tsukamurella pulmonis]